MINPDGPRTIAFMLGWRCNSSCVQCFRHGGCDLPRQPIRSELETADVLALLETYRRTVCFVDLIAFGEPMLHPGFDAIVGAIDSSVVVSCITNGSKLHQHLGILELPGSITISVDGPDRESFEDIRRGLSFDEVTSNIRLALEHRSLRRQVGVAMTIFARNVKRIWGMARLCKELGVDYLSILRATWLEGSDAEGEELETTEPLVPLQINNARRDFPGLQIHNYFTQAKGPFEGACKRPRAELVVFNDGSLHPCCRAQNIVYGSIKEPVWNIPQQLELCRRLERDGPLGEEFSECDTCPWR